MSYRKNRLQVAHGLTSSAQAHLEEANKLREKAQALEVEADADLHRAALVVNQLYLEGEGHLWGVLTGLMDKVGLTVSYTSTYELEERYELEYQAFLTGAYEWPVLEPFESDVGPS